MILNGAFFRAFVFMLAAALFSGCFESQDTPTAEEKDPHYINGRNKVISLDYDGAIDEFAKALESNPKSSAAHFEMGLLYEDRKKNFARAIYHFEEYLELKPRSIYAERAREQIRVCKMELAKSEVMGPVTQQMQRDLDRVTALNIQLTKQVESLNAQLASRPVPQPPSGVSNTVASAGRTETTPPNLARNGGGATGTPKERKPAEPQEAPTRVKTHTVKSGETFASIAKQHNVKLANLVAANPGIDPRRVKSGVVLQLP